MILTLGLKIISNMKNSVIVIHYKKEIPYAVEVMTEDFIEEETIIRIRSVIMVERDTQKGIIIGHKGAAIKRVGAEARKDLEYFFDKNKST